MQTWYLITGCVTAGFIVATYHTLSSPDKTAPEQLDGVTRKKLSKVSVTWRDGKEEIPLKQVAVIWRKPETEAAAVAKLPRPVFENQEIDQFWTEYVDKPVVKKSHRVLIAEILHILEQQGDCPSVVGRGESHPSDQKAEGNLGAAAYDYLAKTVPLWKHTLAVAKKYIPKFSSENMRPDALVISLGHDLGKILGQYKLHYRSADHAQLSVMMLNNMSEFMNLHNREDIAKAIRGHHDLVPKGPLTELLLQADAAAREDAITNMINLKDSIPAPVMPVPPSPQDGESKTVQTTEEVPEIPEPIKVNKPKKPRKKTETETAPKPEDLPPAKEVAPPLGEAKTEKYRVSVVALPDKYDRKAFIAEIGKIINLLIDVNGKKHWHAITDGRGYVWCNETAIWNALTEITGGTDAKLMSASANEGARRNYVYSVVRDLIESDIVEKTFIAEGFPHAAVILTTGSGKKLPAFLTPIRTDVFEMLPSELEQRKPSLLHRMVKDITPKMTENEKCAPLFAP